MVNFRSLRTYQKDHLIVWSRSRKATTLEGSLILGLPSCCPSVLLVTSTQTCDKDFCLKISLKILRMELYALCVCDLKGMLKHCRFFPRQRSILFSRTIQKGSYRSLCISSRRRDLSLLHWFKPLLALTISFRHRAGSSHYHFVRGRFLEADGKECESADTSLLGV